MATIAETQLWHQAVNRVAPLLLPFRQNPSRIGGFWRGLPARAPEILGTLGPLQIRLARNRADIRKSQRLRYRVFFEEMSATAKPWAKFTRRDADPYDALCDHLLVEDPGAPGRRPEVIGSYRLLRGEVASLYRGFYSASEFDLRNLLTHQRTQGILELGRSCVLPAYRNKRTIELLWRGILTYILTHRPDFLIGCASFDSTDPDELALPLSYLHHYASAPAEYRVTAHERGRVRMDRIAKGDIDVRAALRKLPPLIKGYLRVGAFVGDGAVIDHAFGTTDVFMILPVSAISDRYIQHFGSSADLRAA